MFHLSSPRESAFTSINGQQRAWPKNKVKRNENFNSIPYATLQLWNSMAKKKKKKLFQYRKKVEFHQQETLSCYSGLEWANRCNCCLSDCKVHALKIKKKRLFKKMIIYLLRKSQTHRETYFRLCLNHDGSRLCQNTLNCRSRMQTHKYYLPAGKKNRYFKCRQRKNQPEIFYSDSQREVYFKMSDPSSTALWET